MEKFLKNDNCFIIAEISANHNGSFDVAIETIRAAKKAGADAVKIQTYKPETITLDCQEEDFIVKGTVWNGRNLFELYQEAHTPWEWHKEIFKVANDEGLICFSSPFDFSAVDLLESLSNPIYKIASFEITDIPLIKYVASKGKPIIISTGIATIEDIDLALKTCNDQGNYDVTLLKCTSQYPALPEEANLKTITDLKERYQLKIGLSDHTLGIEASIAAVSLGASVIEKHFILDKSIGGPDASFSLDFEEFSKMVKSIRSVEKMIGNVDYELTDKKKTARLFSKSIYVSKDVKKGEIISHENIKVVRPGYGIHPRHFENILGEKFKYDVGFGTRMKFELIE